MGSLCSPGAEAVGQHVLTPAGLWPRELARLAVVCSGSSEETRMDTLCSLNRVGFSGRL